jgi:CheY-like chemotaxis protein
VAYPETQNASASRIPTNAGNACQRTSFRPVIFVVEDDEDIARLISHNLQAAGFEVQSFVSGASVLTEAVREMPALFLLDVMLPGPTASNCAATSARPRCFRPLPSFF